MHSMTTCLCYNNQSEDAVNFYASVFSDLRIMAKTFCGENEPSGPAGSVRTVSFRMLNHDFLAVNAGSEFKFGYGMSIMVNCETQTEIDFYWEKLSEGGQQQECGWLQDKFGVYWQVVPTLITKAMNNTDQKKSQKVMQAVLKMKKLDIATLQKAYEL